MGLGCYFDVVDVHDLVVEDMFDDYGFNLGYGHAHGLLSAGFLLLSVGLLEFGHLQL